MTERKSKPEGSTGPVFHFYDKVEIGRDQVGVQYNIDVKNVETPQQFQAAIVQLQMQVEALRQQPDLNAAQAINLDFAQAKLAEAVQESQKPQPLGERIKATLTEAKDTMELLSGSLQAAATLGATISSLALLAIKVFGG